MKIPSFLIPILALLLIGPAPLRAQDREGTIVDTTIITKDGKVLRYKGELSAMDMPGGEERARAMATDDRVPLGYGWRTIRSWKEGDLRPRPEEGEGFIRTEFFDLRYSRYVPFQVARAFIEYGDFAYFAIKDRFGWTIDEPVLLTAPFDSKEYGKLYGLPWWIPGDVRGDSIVVQPIATITSRGIALEALAHLYLEWHLRQKTGDRLPYWFIYGAGASLAGEGRILKSQVDVLRDKYEVAIDQATMIRDLEIFRDGELMMKEVESPGSLEAERCHSRIAFWRAHQLVENILIKEGQGTFKKLIETMAADPELGFDAAVQRIYGKSVEALAGEYAPW